MSEITRFAVSREPDLQASRGAFENGLHLTPTLANKTEKSRSFSTLDIADQLLTKFVLNANNQAVRVSNKLIPDEQREVFTPLFDEVYCRLQEACENKNAEAVVETTNSILEKLPIMPLNQLAPVVQSAWRYFKTLDGKIEKNDFEIFVRNFSKQELITSLILAPKLVDQLKTQSIVAMAEGSLGSQSYNLLDMLKSLLTFQIIAIWSLERGKENGHAIPIKLVKHILNAQVFIPDFLFFDVCGWLAEATEKDKQSPLEIRIAKKRAYDEKASSKLDAALQRKSVSRVRNENTHPHPDCQVDVEDDQDCICDCETASVCLPPDPCCAEINYYVADTLVLRDKSHCYLAGDLAYIENVAPFEFRERKHRFNLTEVNMSQRESEVTDTETRNQQVTDRYKLNVVINDVIKLSLDVTAQYGDPKKAYIKADAKLSKEATQTETREKFRELVDKSISIIETRTKLTETTTTTSFEEESNTHRFDNQTADASVAKYFYVNKEVEGQVFSHGIAGQVELLIPSPALLYEHLEKLKSEKKFTHKKPKHPCLLISSIDPKKYDFYVETYQLLDLDKPAEELPTLYRSFSLKKSDAETVLVVPTGYTATLLEFMGGISNRAFLRANASLTLMVGSASLRNQWSGNPVGGPPDAPMNATGTLRVYVRNDGCSDKAYISGKVTLTPTSVDHSEWIRTTYQKIMSKYEAQYSAYEEALAAHNREKEEEKFGIHPFTLKEILITEMKRAAIYMMCEDFERNDVMNLKSEPCGYPEINRHKASEKLSDQYFWDRAFDWEHISFIFYDYFWNPMCLWPEKVNPDHQDFMFNSFLRAGYARVVVNVAPGMDADVLWYIKTKEKWNAGGLPPLNPADPRWISVIQELKHSKDCFQNDREGWVVGILDSSQPTNIITNKILLTETDRYWDASAGTVDQIEINKDLNREIYVDGVMYKLQDIQVLVASDPDYGHLHDMSQPPSEQWVVTLDRLFEGDAADDGTGQTFPKHTFAIGALFVGAPFRWKELTSLIWIGDQKNDCLPCYPVECE
ncbi:MAG: hypothetical protein OFPII_30550 [Osedax symbiont Rs1]|nr:MAG: hypothetical protein OFPII_30550 [Osedax symbiont Rs1]